MQKQHKLKVKGCKKERHMFVKLKQHKMIEECGFTGNRMQRIFCLNLF